MGLGRLSCSQAAIASPAHEKASPLPLQPSPRLAGYEEIMRRNGGKRTPVTHTDVIVAKPHCERQNHPHKMFCKSCALPGIAEHFQQSNFMNLLALPRSTKEAIVNGAYAVLCCTSSNQWLHGCHRKTVYGYAFR